MNRTEFIEAFVISAISGSAKDKSRARPDHVLKDANIYADHLYPEEETVVPKISLKARSRRAAES